MDFLQKRLLFISKYLPDYLQGLKLTLLLSLIGVIFGALVGSLLALGRRSKSPVLRKFTTAVVEIIRGTPLIVQITLFVYSMLNVIPPDLAFLRNKLFLATIPMCLNSGAYVSEIIRAGIQSINKGQEEAARSLGLTEKQTMTYIIMPQAIKNILPALGNEFVTLIKESAVVSIVALHDMMYYAEAIRGSTYKAFEPYFYVAVIYFILTYGISKLLGRFERRLQASDNG